MASFTEKHSSVFYFGSVGFLKYVFALVAYTDGI